MEERRMSNIVTWIMDSLESMVMTRLNLKTSAGTGGKTGKKSAKQR
jgi:hypothetical protein